jgi:hypothetical protein
VNVLVEKPKRQRKEICCGKLRNINYETFCTDLERSSLMSESTGSLSVSELVEEYETGFRVSEMPFPGLWGIFDRILMVRKQRNLQFGGTKWAKAYLINYILDKLQESMGNIFILRSLSWIM